MITNLDPKPWLVDEVPARYTDDEIKESARSDNPILWQLARHDPRPEFDVGDNHVLRFVAADIEDGIPLIESAEDWLPWLDEVYAKRHPEADQWIIDQIAHARTVLETIVGRGSCQPIMKWRLRDEPGGNVLGSA